MLKSRRPILAGIAAVITVMGMLHPVTARAAVDTDAQRIQTENSSPIAEMTAGWWNRESRFDTVEMSWHVVRDSARSSNNYQIEFPRPADRKRSPESETLWLSGRRICYEASRWYAELDGEFAGYDKEYLFSKFVESMRKGQQDIRNWDRPPYRFRLVWDPAAHREILDGADGRPALGTNRNATKSLLLNSGDGISAGLIFWPALMALRPTTALGVTPANHALVAEKERSAIGGQQCVVVVGQSSAASAFRLWVAPDQGDSVVRAMFYSGDNLRQQFDIEYAKEQDGGWFPSAWNILVFNPEGAYPGQAESFRSVRIEVDRHAINGPLDSARFEIEFPNDTLVTDKGTNKTYVVSQGKSQRPPTHDELLLLSGKGEPKRNESQAPSSRRLKISCALAVSLGVLWMLRRRRISRSSSDKSRIAPDVLTDGGGDARARGSF